MREIKSHTALRGIAAVLVVIYHFRSTLTPALDLDSHTQLFARGYLWVDCFFILSGFILSYVYGTRPAESSEQRSRFFLARFARIYPLHLATLLCLVALQLGSRFTNHPFLVGGGGTFFLNLFGIHAWGMLGEFDWNFPSWSISVEFASYLLFPLICAGLSKHRRASIFLLAITIPLALMIGRDHWEQTALLHGLPMFFLGILLFEFRSKLPKRGVGALQIATGAALVASLHFGIPDFIVDMLFASVIWLTWTDAGLASFLATRPLQMLGDWSFSIYMLHIPVRLVLGFVLGGFASPTAQFFIPLLVTICAGAMSYRYFEMPIRNLLRQQRVVIVA
jgi:peptidoglycan/LPS O-acetylase OafA/YrhL